MLCNIFNEICNIARRSQWRAVSLAVSQFNVAIIFVADIKVDATQRETEKECVNYNRSVLVICHCRDVARIAVCQFNNPDANYILESITALKR